jgi:hypothetical protein
MVESRMGESSYVNQSLDFKFSQEADELIDLSGR